MLCDVDHEGAVALVVCKKTCSFRRVRLSAVSHLDRVEKTVHRGYSVLDLGALLLWRLESIVDENLLSGRAKRFLLKTEKVDDTRRA